LNSYTQVVKVEKSIIGGDFRNKRTLLVGSVFYRGDKSVLNHEKGLFDKQTIRGYVEEIEKLKELSGLQHAYDVIFESVEAARKFISFIADVSEDPIFLDGVSKQARIGSVLFAKEIGIEDRCVVNAILCETSDDELNAILNSNIKCAVLMASEMAMFKPTELIDIVANKLISLAKRAGIHQWLVDVGVIDLPSMAFSLRNLRSVKEKLKLPVGCAPCNAAYKLLVDGKLRLEEVRAVNSALLSMLVLEDADYIIYGPIKAASYAFHVCATVKAVKVYGEEIEKRDFRKTSFIHGYLKKLSK